MDQLLHITNGDEFSHNLRELEIPGDIIVWREMLCEGPTYPNLDTPEFLELRKNFLKQTYKVSPDDYETQFVEELNKLTVANGYDEIVLWFEFDLFSHINMLAVISHLLEHKKNIPVNLVCSKRLEDEKEFSPLSQLSLKHLKNHYEARIPLAQEDLETAALIWQLYNGNNPQKLISQIKKKTNFEYLSSCIRAHIERFPNAVSGINTLERNVLKLIEKNDITSRNHLIGYVLEYQGYFGYGDMQVQRMIDALKIFYEIDDAGVSLNEAGRQALNAEKNFYQELKNNDYLGGVKKYDFLYDAETHKILKL